MRTWSFLGDGGVLRASAWPGGVGGGGNGGGVGGEGVRAGTGAGQGRVGAGSGDGSSGEGRNQVGPCSCPLGQTEVRTPLRKREREGERGGEKERERLVAVPTDRGIQFHTHCTPTANPP